MFGLIDCNNFFVSCERVFRPDLKNRPVIVLSNNDGCAVARSDEVKRLGIPMGAPHFKIRDLIKKHNIEVFSSNFSLYTDMSARVMQILTELSPKIEIYSVDEAFIDLRGIADLSSFARKVHGTILQSTGLPISIGIAPTKTLAKVANYFSKKQLERGGICILKAESDIDKALSEINVRDIWGVGRQTSSKLSSYGIYTGLDLKQVSPQWIRKISTVVAERLVRELQGLSCLKLEDDMDPKSIQVTRGFGKPITEFDKLREVVSFYASRAGERLRRSQKRVKTITIFVQTNYFKQENYYSKSITITLSHPVDDDASLIQACCEGVKKIFKAGYFYKKAGVLLIDLLPKDVYQYDLFAVNNENDLDQKTHLSKTMDKLNRRFGRGTISYGACGLSPTWRDTKTNISPAYTTSWNDLREVY